VGVVRMPVAMDEEDLPAVRREEKHKHPGENYPDDVV
jgi:hypothetical protein